MNEIVNLGNGQYVKICMLKGKQGDSIQSIAKTSTNVLVDTYTITLTDGSTQTFTVTNGKGIVSIEKTGTSGLVDTYTITFNDSTSQTFTVTNGNGIVSIEKTSTVGLVDTYTITFNDNTSKTFTVTNGADGVGITSIIKTGTSGLVDTYTITFTDGTTTTFDVTNGANGQDVGQSNLAPVETGNTASQSYAVGSHLIWNGIYYVVTQAIASGGTLSVGLNISQDNISNEIMGINTFDSDEKFVGFWFGKRVYKKIKSYTFQNLSSASDLTGSFSMDINDATKILFVTGFLYPTGSTHVCHPLPYIRVTSNVTQYIYLECGATTNGVTVFIRYGQNNTGLGFPHGDGYIIVYYTKD